MFFSPDECSGQLYERPLTCFTSASDVLKRHADQKAHKDSVVKQSSFLATYANAQPNVLQQLQDKHSQQAVENMDKLRSILSCIEYCGRQGIALWGHRESGFSVTDLDTPLSFNPGNFLALVRFRLEAGDERLLHYFHTSGNLQGKHSVTYLSPLIQNELIECLGEELQSLLLAEVRRAPHFVVLADEATDSSNKEQLPLVLRFVDLEDTIREELIDVLHCSEGITGEAISNLIEQALLTYNLDMSWFRGQVYDGAGGMSGWLQGCAARLAAKYTKALYMHCSSHCSNLCVANATNVQDVQMFWVKEVNFFYEYSPKRANELTTFIKDSDSNTRKTKLISLCKT